MGDDGAATTADTAHDMLDGDVTTVTELNADLNEIINGADLHFDYVVGDCSDLYEPASGHLHFDLVYDETTIHCLVLSYRRDRLSADLEEDAHIAVQGSLSYYEDESEVTIIVDDVVELGEGEYEAIYRENREQLAEDGVLDDDAKQPLPEYPVHVGVVTSAKSDAREDAITSLHARNPSTDITVQDATVQGDTAVESLLEGISRLDRDTTIDVIVVTRGGGADKHLRVYNDIALCRVIAKTETPVVTAVGHENDRVLAGEVADERAMTPTEIGTTLYPQTQADLVEACETAADRLHSAYATHATETIAAARDTLHSAYSAHTQQVIDQTEAELDRAFETHTTQELTELENQLEHTFEARKQREQMEEEKEEAVAETKTTYQRRLRIATAAIIVLLLLLLAVGIMYLL